MKLLAGLAVAASLASSAAAAAVASAPVYILSKALSPASSASAASPPPAVPRQIARHILLQRLAATDATAFFDTLPRDYDADAALRLVDLFAGSTAAARSSLFGAASDDAVRARHPEMLLVVEGVASHHVAAVEAALEAAPAFAVADPPSQAANARLFGDELARNGIAAHKDVALADARAPHTWVDGVFVGLYDVQRDPAVVDKIVEALPAIVAFANAGDADVTVVLMPEGSRTSKNGVWAEAVKSKNKPAAKKPSVPGIELRADESVFIEGADAELALDSETAFVKASTDKKETAGEHAFVPAAARGPIPACFQSFNSCVAQTNTCSGHGTCVDKYAVNSGGIAAAAQKGGAAAASCFVCHCYSTLNRPEDAEGGLSTTQWAGNMCQKIDVSVPFWLITGFSVALVGVVAFSIGLLFSVGEEKLPGVIGAGVSRSK